MSNAQHIIRRRNKAKQILNELFTSAKRVNAIHYSCESFFDRSDGSSPRITSIAVRNLETGQTASFSIHQLAERNGYRLAQIESNYDQLEHQMLDEFFQYVKNHLEDYVWLHWNMRNINYGFLALGHRYQVLGGQPVIPANHNLVDLSLLFRRIYGENYIDDPRLQMLARKNNLLSREFMPGEREAIAFEKREFVKLHQSTLKKVDIIAYFAEKAWQGKLKTNRTWREVQSTGIVGIVETATDHWAFKLAGAVGLVFTLLTGLELLIRSLGLTF